MQIPSFSYLTLWWSSYLQSFWLITGPKKAWPWNCEIRNKVTENLWQIIILWIIKYFMKVCEVYEGLQWIYMEGEVMIFCKDSILLSSSLRSAKPWFVMFSHPPKLRSTDCKELSILTLSREAGLFPVLFRI